MYIPAVMLMFNLIGMAAIHYYNTSNLTVLPKVTITPWHRPTHTPYVRSPSVNPKPESTSMATYNSAVPTYTLTVLAPTYTPTPYVSPYVLKQQTAKPTMTPNFKIDRLIEALDAERFDWTAFTAFDEDSEVSACCAEPSSSPNQETSVLAASFPFVVIISYLTCLFLLVGPKAN